ncbi:hypothetical protein PB1_10674 [Bacillus methanolicus PB1]|uniref:Uncharacterized protein n=1 Tax=Bacillus methanolicus PB1 TaxID=997296 RepID=I3DUV2_BACMT|nr:hypothetical protein [Bacillus methanolicus]EIJ78023.1 hypothetical protein PB1_10674 [Bacillus methanolicus PB1]
MNPFWTGFGVGAISIFTLCFAGNQIYQKYFKKKEAKYLKFIIPILCVGIALIILYLNIESILNPGQIENEGILNYVLTNQAILHLLIYVGALSLIAVVWILTTFPFNFDGLKKFSGFGLTAEFNEKVQEVVESRSLINEMSYIRENIMKIITSEQYYNETLITVIVKEHQNYSIDITKLFDAVLETIQTSYESSESTILIKYHLELVEKDDLEKARERLKEIQKEMSEACLAVIQKNKPYVWKGTLAVPIAPFDIEKEQDSYYIMCIHTEDTEFNRKDIDFLYTVINVIEKFVDLLWYKKVAFIESDDPEQVV